MVSMDHYLQSKKIVEKRYPKEDLYYPFFVLAMYGILSKYPDYVDEIDSLFQTIAIYIESGTVIEIMKKHNLESDSFFAEEEEIDQGDFTTFAVSSKGDTFYIADDDHSITHRSNPFLICSIDCSLTTLLHCFIHEMNHLIKGIHNGLSITCEENQVGYSIRTGLDYYHYHYDYSLDLEAEINYFSTLDETINVFQTTDMVQEISALDGIVPDEDVQRLFTFLDPESMNQDFGYNSCTKLLRPLWENEIFKNFVERHLMEGNIQSIILFFDEVLEYGSFMNLADSLDELDYLETIGMFSTHFQFLKDHIREMIQKFNKKSQKIYSK